MSYKTMKQSQDWKKNYNWTDKNDHPVEDNEFQPKVLKDQVVKFYKKPKTKTLKSGRKIKVYGSMDYLIAPPEKKEPVKRKQL